MLFIYEGQQIDSRFDTHWVEYKKKGIFQDNSGKIRSNLGVCLGSRHNF